MKLKDTVKSIGIFRFFMLTLAGTVNAFGITLFLMPVKLYDSGISGTSMLLAQVTPDKLSLSLFLITLNILNGRCVIMVCQCPKQAAAPIEVLCGDIQSNIAQIIWQFIRVGINGEKSIKSGRTEADPFNRFDAFRNPCADLAHRSDASSVDSDRAVHPPLSGVTVGIGVVRCSLIM